MKYTNQGFSIIFALWITLLLSLTALYLIEYMIPFSKNIKWVENASQAYYNSHSWIEESLILIHSWSLWQDYSDDFVTDSDISLSVSGSWTEIPQINGWNSEYNTSRNRLSLWEPIQLYIWRNRLATSWLNRPRLQVNIPDLDRNSINDETLDISPNDDIIFWQLSAGSQSFSASWSLITESEINSVISYQFWTQNWVDLSWVEDTFGSFYDGNCRWVNDECILRILVINPLISSSDSTPIPYLEYWITANVNTGVTSWIPYPIIYVRSLWKKSGFSKTLNVDVTLDTINSAFDFTVFQ